MQLSDWVENIVLKGEIAHYEQFLLFPQYFQKLSCVDASKWVSLECRVNPTYRCPNNKILDGFKLEAFADNPPPPPQKKKKKM